MLWKSSLRLFETIRQRGGSTSVLKTAFTFVLLLTAFGCWGQVGIPKTPAGNALQAWLDAINSGEVAKVSAYVKSTDSTQTVDWLMSLSQHSGGFELLSAQSKGPWLISFHVRERNTTTEAAGSIKVRKSQTLTVTSFTIRPLPPGAVIDDIALDAAERTRVIDGAIAALKEYYLYPDVAGKMADALLQDKRSGNDNVETDGGAFAFSLTKLLRVISHDKHLEVIYNPFKLHQGPPEVVDNRVGHSQDRPDNCGITSTRILAGNVGYLKVDAFPEITQCQSRIEAVMHTINQTDSLIFDLRQNHGGDPRTVALIASYLFDHPTHLNDMYNPRTGTTEASWTQSPIPGNNLASKPVFVLTSAMTFSGGEEFCYDLKMLQRATIVGESTGGGAHPIRLHQIDDHFTIAVPFAKPVNPISKTDWEGSGVVPEVSVKATEALETAIKLAADKPKHRK
jgi:hypothetical protein